MRRKMTIGKANVDHDDDDDSTPSKLRRSSLSSASRYREIDHGSCDYDGVVAPPPPSASTPLHQSPGNHHHPPGGGGGGGGFDSPGGGGGTEGLHHRKRLSPGNARDSMPRSIVVVDDQGERTGAWEDTQLVVVEAPRKQQLCAT
eukprot:CAMPEP_0181134358 /NCGR_PEP_ID=MMETSP1071-20121207/32046_1 /TAXON_ID=35127 /ORGANISM="Thalassiosira sp., Strain NH16" /LENGTH=144 /DNA_ID=CAMNT_0023220873 /DNA_START=58 /DNA_END=492 /DNA_ORIENTATION=+